MTTVTTMSSGRSEECVSRERILCDDCHDDELQKERRVRVEGERDTTVIERRS